MSSNAVFFGWNRSIPGRERVSKSHFEEFVGYLTGLQKGSQIESFDVAFLNPHGGDMNGFFLIRGSDGGLDAMMSSADWVKHITRANLHLQGAGAVKAVTGKLVAERMALWSSLIPD